MNAELQAKAEGAAASEKTIANAAIGDTYRLIDDAFGSIGGIEVAAGICGIESGDLRRALDKRGRKLSVDYVIQIGTRLRNYNPSLTAKLGSALVRSFDLMVFPKVTLTAEERADRLERLVLAMPMGAQLLAHALEGKP